MLNWRKTWHLGCIILKKMQKIFVELWLSRSGIHADFFDIGARKSMTALKSGYRLKDNSRISIMNF